METITLLQHYWWLIISLLGALLVFLLFVQGGQGLLYCLGRTERNATCWSIRWAANGSSPSRRW